MGRALRPGEEVSWNTGQGTTHGPVVKKTAGKGRAEDHKMAAIKGSPEYVVESAKTGKRAVHKRKALRKT
jgi:hypothetical protein